MFTLKHRFPTIMGMETQNVEIILWSVEIGWQTKLKKRKTESRTQHIFTQIENLSSFPGFNEAALNRLYTLKKGNGFSGKSWCYFKVWFS